MDPKQHPDWHAFAKWAEANGVELDYYEDWGAWWDCWFAGVCYAMNLGS